VHIKVAFVIRISLGFLCLLIVAGNIKHCKHISSKNHKNSDGNHIYFPFFTAIKVTSSAVERAVHPSGKGFKTSNQFFKLKFINVPLKLSENSAKLTWNFIKKFMYQNMIKIPRTNRNFFTVFRSDGSIFLWRLSKRNLLPRIFIFEDFFSGKKRHERVSLETSEVGGIWNWNLEGSKQSN
jgi:hypothetical protein